MTALDLAPLAWRIVRGSLLGLAGFGLVAHALLLAGQSVWAGLLPLALLGGIAAAGSTKGDPSGPPAPGMLRAGVVLLLAATLAALAYGALATPARHWDGFVSWEMKATVLAAAPTLDQPFFTDHAVYAHSRDYPLLQPLAQASLHRLAGPAAGRALFPLLWLLAVVLLGTAARRAGQPAAHAWLAALGLGSMPMLVSPTSGAVDSGYAELAMLTALTGVAAAFLLRDAWLLGACCVLAILVKPEGTVYAIAVAGCAFVLGPRRLAAAAVLGSALALSLWLPLLDFLQLGGAAAAQAPHGLRTAALGAAALAALVLQARLPSAGQRAGAVLAAGVVAVALWWPAGNSGIGALAAYAHNLAHLPERAARAPNLALAAGAQAFAVQRFGLLFPLLACALLGGRRALDAGGRRVAVLLGLGALIVATSMLLAPEVDFAHHVRSSLHRLLLQWTGVAVLCATLCLSPQPSAERIPSP